MSQAHFHPRYASEYAANIRRIMPFYDQMIGEVACMLECFVGPRARVIELGCGNGELIERLYENGADEVVGVDYSEAVIHHVEQRFADRLGETFFTVKGDISDDTIWADPALHKPADMIVASLIFHDLETIEQKRRFFAHVASILHSGGIFCFADPLDDGREITRHVAQWTECMALDSKEIRSLRKDDPCMFQPISRAELCRLASLVGLRPEGRRWAHLHFSVELFRKY